MTWSSNWCGFCLRNLDRCFLVICAKWSVNTNSSLSSRWSRTHRDKISQRYCRSSISSFICYWTLSLQTSERSCWNLRRRATNCDLCRCLMGSCLTSWSRSLTMSEWSLGSLSCISLAKTSRTWTITISTTFRATVKTGKTNTWTLTNAPYFSKTQTSNQRSHWANWSARTS